MVPATKGGEGTQNYWGGKREASYSILKRERNDLLCVVFPSSPLWETDHKYLSPATSGKDTMASRSSKARKAWAIGKASGSEFSGKASKTRGERESFIGQMSDTRHISRETFLYKLL